MHSIIRKILIKDSGKRCAIYIRISAIKPKYSCSLGKRKRNKLQEISRYSPRNEYNSEYESESDSESESERCCSEGKVCGDCRDLEPSDSESIEDLTEYISDLTLKKKRILPFGDIYTMTNMMSSIYI